MITIEERELIEFTVHECISIYGLNSSLEKLLINNIVKRAEMYGNLGIPKIEETQIIKNNNTMALFFLNRFINNIRNYNIESELNLDGGKGEFINSHQELNMHSYASIQQVTKEKLKDRMNVDNNTLNRATAKVFNHELGHAFQTTYSGTVGFNDTKFIELLDNLKKTRPDVFNSYRDLSSSPLKIEKKGMDVVRKKDIHEKARNFYAPYAYTTYLDEIFNEDEALEVTGVDKPQFAYPINQNVSREVYNYESSNYRISPYARMMKILLGNKRTFSAMYGDSIIAYDYFDNFSNIAKEVFVNEKRNVPPMYIILEKMHKIKTSKKSSELTDECVELDLFFSKCLEQKVNIAMGSQNLSNEQIQILIDRVNSFANNLLKSNSLLPANKIINSLKEKLNSRLEQVSVEELLDQLDNEDQSINRESNSIDSLMSELDKDETPDIAVYDSYTKILESMYEARLVDNEIVYQNLLPKSRELESKMPKIISGDFSKLDRNEKVHFLLSKMKVAIENKELDDYLYYQANLNSVLSNKSLDEKSMRQ